MYTHKSGACDLGPAIDGARQAVPYTSSSSSRSPSSFIRCCKWWRAASGRGAAPAVVARSCTAARRGHGQGYRRSSVVSSSAQRLPEAVGRVVDGGVRQPSNPRHAPLIRGRRSRMLLRDKDNCGSQHLGHNAACGAKLNVCPRIRIVGPNKPVKTHMKQNQCLS